METIIWILAAYGMSQILVFGAIFDTPRDWITKHSTFFGDLLGCMMCTSTWVGFFLSITLGGITKDLFNVGYFGIFFDGLFTAGAVWALNSVIEFFEESRIK